MMESTTFFFQQDELVKSTFLVLENIILRQDKDVTSALKYGMPFFYYKGKIFCYLWFHKKYKQPYIGIVEGNRFNESVLIQEKRSRIKIMLFDPNEDLPLETIESILQKAINFYKTGEIKIKERQGK